jgi:hypothetical protein
MHPQCKDDQHSGVILSPADPFEPLLADGVRRVREHGDRATERLSITGVETLCFWHFSRFPSSQSNPTTAKSMFQNIYVRTFKCQLTPPHIIEFHPLSARFDETDAMAIFDDGLVPWERVFIHRDAELCNGLYNRAGIMPQIMHQFSTKNLAKSEFMTGLAFAIAKATYIDQHLQVQGMLADPVHRVLPRLPPS